MNRLFSFLVLGFALVLARPTAAQPAPMPARMVPTSIYSGDHDGAATADSARLAFQHTVHVPGARWLQLRFARYRLGEGSFLRLTAREDGARQHLTAEGLESWRLHSAFFNGDAVTVELFVAPGDAGAFFELAEAAAGTPPEDPETICDGSDERTASSDDAIGRLVTPNDGRCTGWLASNGAFLAAGHCTATTTIEYNVPTSDSDGTLNHPDPEDQYAVDNFIFEADPDPDDPGDTIPGQDWMVFDVDPNTETGLLPGKVQGAFYRVTQDVSPSSFRITGYGTDDGTTNGIQQTDTGTNEGETVEDPSWVTWEHRVDSMGGNSGSAISLTDAALSVGIHTHGGCTDDGGANQGVSFESDDLAAALDNFFGTDVVHLDVGHPFALSSGTPLRPYSTLGSAVSGVPTGGSIRAVEGTYTVGATVYTKEMVWQAPVGAVVVR